MDKQIGYGIYSPKLGSHIGILYHTTAVVFMRKMPQDDLIEFSKKVLEKSGFYTDKLQGQIGHIGISSWKIGEERKNREIHGMSSSEFDSVLDAATFIVASQYHVDVWSLHPDATGIGFAYLWRKRGDAEQIASQYPDSCVVTVPAPTGLHPVWMAGEWPGHAQCMREAHMKAREYASGTRVG